MTRLTSLVVPTLNEDLVRALRTLDEALAACEGNFEVLFVDDSPDDRRAAERDALARVSGRCTARLIEGPRRGKGAAVRAGVLETAGSVVFTMDADLPVPLLHIGPFLRRIDDGADVVIAERPLDREFDSWTRYLVSRGLLVIQRTFVFHSREYRDTQCGFKAFRGDLARDIARGQIVDGGMCDLEYLFEAHRRGAKVEKVSIVPNPETRESRINVWNCIKGDWVDVVRIRTKSRGGR